MICEMSIEQFPRIPFVGTGRFFDDDLVPGQLVVDDTSLKHMDSTRQNRKFQYAVGSAVPAPTRPPFALPSQRTVTVPFGSDPVYCFRSNSSIRSRSFFFDLDPEIAFWARRIKLLTLSGCDRPNAVASSRSVAVVRRWAR